MPITASNGRHSSSSADPIVRFMLAGLALPWAPLGQILGFVHLPATYCLWVTFVVAAYILTVQFVKGFYLPRIGSWLLGYPFALVLMVISAILPFYIFKKKGWL